MFENKDAELKDFGLNNIFEDIAIPKLNSNEASETDGYLSMNELGMALKTMKNNKVPGIDGFPSEFFKVFWSKLGHYIHRSINYSFDTSNLPLTLRRCLIN